jgi:hypothetical protein
VIYIIISAFVLSVLSVDLYVAIFDIKMGLRAFCVTFIYFASFRFLLCVVLCMSKYEIMHGYLEDYDFKCITV